MVGRAIRNDWPITPAMRAKVLRALFSVVEDSPDERSIIAASRAIIAADTINLNREKLDLIDEHKQQQLPDTDGAPQVVITLPDNQRDGYQPTGGATDQVPEQPG